MPVALFAQVGLFDALTPLHALVIDRVALNMLAMALFLAMLLRLLRFDLALALPWRDLL